MPAQKPRNEDTAVARISTDDVGDVSEVLGKAGEAGAEQQSYLPTLSDDVGEGGVVRPTQLKIMQPSTPEVASGEYTGGVWASSLIGELGKEIVVVPLQQGRFRIMNNPDKEFGQNEIVCSSPDSITGYVNAESDWLNKDKLGGECAQCPMKEFTRDPKTGRRRPPLCTFNRTYASYMPDPDLVTQITFRRTSAPAGEDILSVVQQSRQFGLDAFRLTLHFTQRGAYSYYVPRVRRLNIDEEWMDNISEAKALLQSGLGAQMSQGAFDEAAADSGATFNSNSGFAS